MASVAIGTAAAISAYFFGQAFSGRSLNGSDPIKEQPLTLPYYLWVFGCGLVFWLLVLLWPNLRHSGNVVSLHTEDKDPQKKDIREVAKLITVITTINLCGCLVLPVRKLPLLVRFLVLFQLSSNLALLLIWTLLSIHKYIMEPDAATFKCTEYLRRRKEGPTKWQEDPDADSIWWHHCKGCFLGCQSRLQAKGKSDVESLGKGSASKGRTRPTANVYFVREDYRGEAGASGSEHAKDDRVSSSTLCPTTKDERLTDIYERVKGQIRLQSYILQSKGKNDVKGVGEGSAARGETRPTPNIYSDRGDGYRGEDEASESEHDGDGEGDASGGNHGSEAGGRKESGVGSGGDGGGGGGDECRGVPEHGVRERNKEPTLKISKISEMSFMLVGQISATLIGFHIATPSSSTEVLKVIVLVDQLVGYLCGLTSMLLELQNPRVARVFERVGFACTTLGYVLMVAMFVHWYIVLIVILAFGIVWIIFFQHVWHPLLIDARFWLVNNCPLLPSPNIDRMVTPTYC